MPELEFKVDDAEVVAHAVAPLLAFKLTITNGEETERIQSVSLRCQIQLETTRRKYAAAEQKQLSDLFGEPSRWAQTLRSMLWTHTNVVVPSFQGSIQVDLPVPCTFDFNVAATKYFAALTDGEVPLNLLFSGTVFYESPDEALQVSQIPWDRETKYRLPVRKWREMMNLYYPNTAWLCLRRDVFDRLSQFKMEKGIPTWEQAIERLLPEAEPREDDVMTVEGSLPA